MVSPWVSALGETSASISDSVEAARGEPRLEPGVAAPDRRRVDAAGDVARVGEGIEVAAIAGRGADLVAERLDGRGRQHVAQAGIEGAAALREAPVVDREA